MSSSLCDLDRGRDRASHCAIVCEHVAVQRIESGIVDVRLENTLAQVIEAQ